MRSRNSTTRGGRRADQSVKEILGHADLSTTSKCLATTLVLGMTLATSLASAQAGSDGWTVPRTADGRPDLQGVWNFRTMTPLQRPEDQENAVLTEEEVAELEQRAAERVTRADAPSEVRTEPLPAGEPVGGYNRFWLDRGGRVVDDHRTSLIVDPPTGRVPKLQPGALRQVGSLGEDLPSERPVRYRSGGIYPDGAEDRGVSERCIVGFNSGPPLLPWRHRPRARPA